MDLFGLKTYFRLNSFYQPTFSFDANVAPCVKLVSIEKNVDELNANPASAVILRVACHTEHLYKGYSLQCSLAATDWTEVPR